MVPSLGIKMRLDALEDLSEKVEYLSENKIKELSEKASKRFGFSRGKLHPARTATIQELNLYEEDEESVRIFLESLVIPEDENIYLLWIVENTGITIKYGEFVDHFDDLWYPASDDIWVMNDNLEWLLQISHEEIATFIALAQSP